VNAETWSTLGKNLPGVVSLSLTHFSFSNVSSLAQVVSSFPLLRELSMRGLMRSTWTAVFQPELPSATMFRLPPNLHTLEVRISGMGAVLEWLLSLEARPALRTLRLYDISDGDLATVHKVIKAFGGGLESLSLSSLVKDCTLPHLICQQQHDS
jgi:hypothetical protein